LGKPIPFGRYKRVGIEAAYAIHTWAFNALFTNTVSLAALPGVSISFLSFEISTKHLTWIQCLDVIGFNLLLAYIFCVFWSLSLSDPGRITSSIEKDHLNNRYERLYKELKYQQKEAEDAKKVDVDHIATTSGFENVNAP
jgi:hypothetical protein